MKIYNELESLGFFEWLSETYNLKDSDMKPEYLDELPLNDIHRTVGNSMALRWFRDKYDLWCCIQKYPTSDNPKRCYYELKGDNINTDKDESPNSYMSGWFDTYEEAESACLDKLIEICKNNYCHYSGLPSTSSYDQ